MSWLSSITERGTLFTLEIGPEGATSTFNYRATPCIGKDGEKKGSYACFLDLATLPDHKSGAQIEALAALIQEIKALDMVPVVAPDNRPLPSANGVARRVGGFMVYANPAFAIKPKASSDAK